MRFPGEWQFGFNYRVLPCVDDLPPLEIENWVEDGKRGMENALLANPQDVREQYER